jgi:REP element-mobilizing transposase RayT
MKNPTMVKRKELRIKDYDYSLSGFYFITICTQRRKKLFGNIKDGEMIINNLGKAILDVWNSLPYRFPSISIDIFVVMPNHIHGIIIVGAQFIAPESCIPGNSPKLGQVVRTFKAVSTYKVRKNLDPDFAWQRNYYEHVIRNEESLNRIREYIITNPLRWQMDRESPAAIGKDDFDRWLATFSLTTISQSR